MFAFENVRFKDILRIDKLEIPAHTISCIVGPSGGGKSTLLKLINNLFSADEGQILYQGKNIEEFDPVKLRRKVIMLPQKPVTFEGDVQDNLEVAFDLTERKSPEKVKLKEMLEMVQLNKKLNVPANRLSGGEKQRLSLARILLLQPEVLLLDEPSSALDEATEKLVIERVIEYVEENNKTLVMITHSKAIARNYGDKIITIKEGQVVEEEN